jgi:hypothetical protein
MSWPTLILCPSTTRLRLRLHSIPTICTKRMASVQAIYGNPSSAPRGIVEAFLSIRTDYDLREATWVRKRSAVPSLLPSPSLWACCTLGPDLPSPHVGYQHPEYICLLKPALLPFSGLRHAPVTSKRSLHTSTQPLLHIGSPFEPGDEKQRASESRRDTPTLTVILYNWQPGRQFALPSHLLHSSSLIALFSALKTVAIHSSETSVHIRTLGLRRCHRCDNHNSYG